MSEDLFIFLEISLGIIIMIDLIFMGVCILKKGERK